MSREATRNRALLAAYLVVVFTISAITDLRALGAAWVLAIIALRRGALAHLLRLVMFVLPFTGGLSLATWLWERLAHAAAPDWTRLVSLNLRATLLAFITMGAMRRINLCQALAFSTTLSRLLAITMAQVHGLRILGRESYQGLRSRLLRKPRTSDVLRSAATITGTLVVLSATRSRDVADALRSRGV